MGAAGNKKPKKDKSSKHGKHVPSYQLENDSSVKVDSEDLKKKK